MPKLLVIDDDRAVLYMIGQAFKDVDLTVLTARDVERGLELMAQGPDVVLLDIMLQETSGLEAFRKIHALDGKLPVIFITAQDSSDTAIEAMKLGAYDYLLKPLDLPKLRPGGTGSGNTTLDAGSRGAPSWRCTRPHWRSDYRTQSANAGGI